MTPVDYIISVTASDSNREIALAVRKTLGHAQVLCGSSNEDKTTHLFVIPAARKSRQELTSQLQSIPEVSNVSVVALSQPIKENELADVRKIFASINWDASSVLDDELSIFIDDKLYGQWTYYIDLEHNRKGSAMPYMRIKRLKEHPDYSPDWLSKSGRKYENTQELEPTVDEIETHEVMIEMREEDNPLPPSPANLYQMTNEQIKRWIRKNDDRILSEKDIEIRRTSEETHISIILDGGAETMGYKLTK